MNREKILLIASVAVALFVGYDLLIAKKNIPIESTNASIADQNKILEPLLKGIKSNVLNPVELYIIKNAKQNWSNAPFPLDSFFREELVSVEEMVRRQMDAVGIEESVGQKIIKDADKNKEKLTFIYSGYMEMGKSNVAVIDGKEYVIGDKIGNFVVRNISDKKIVLYSSLAGNERTIPFDFQEEM